MPTKTNEHIEAQALCDRLIREREVLRLLSIARSHWTKGVSTGRFPPPVRLGRSIRWRLSDIQRVVEQGAP
jgi:predicted DNA-binding transcriptional regulator AlpA